MKLTNESSSDNLLSASNAVGITRAEEIEILFNALSSQLTAASTGLRKPSVSEFPHNLFKIVIFGSDWSIGCVLRAFWNIYTKDPRGWENVAFCPVSMSSDCRVFKHLCRVDPDINILFQESLWKGVTTEVIPRGVLSSFLSSVSRYVSDCSKILKFQFASALVELNDSLGKSETSERSHFPFMSDFQVYGLDAQDDVKDAVSNASVQVEIWHYCPKKPKEVKSLIKGDLSFLRVTRMFHSSELDELKSIDFDSKSDEPLAFPDSMSVEDMRAFFLDVAVYDKKTFSARFSSVASKSPKKPADLHHLQVFATKILVTPVGENKSLQISIDGEKRRNVKLLSLSAQSSGRLKYFPVCVFGH
jgi:hypothetical protein